MDKKKPDELAVYRRLIKNMNRLAWSVIALLALVVYFSFDAPGLNELLYKEEIVLEQSEQDDSKSIEDEVVNGIHQPTGLAFADGFELIQQNCLACHSSKLITQNRMSRERWKETIVWMQETQKLWDLGVNESRILDYLAKNYAPKKKGRRANLVINEWYEIQ